MPLSDNYNEAFDNKRFSAIILKKALTEVLSSLGSSWREIIIEDMAKKGINLDGDASYSINEIRPHIYAAFEEEMGEVMINKLKNTLRSGGDL